MSDGSILCLFGAGFVILLSGVIVGGLALCNKTEGSWKKFASHNNFSTQHTRGTNLPRISGDYKEFGFDMVHCNVHKKDKYMFPNNMTKISLIILTAVDWNMSIYPEGFMSKIEKLSGEQDVQLGDEEFDKTFMVVTNNPERVKEVLTPEIRSYLLKGKHLINIKFDGYELANRTDGVVEDLNDLNYITEALWHIIKNIAIEKNS
jgi:hypothetical protein